MFKFKNIDNFIPGKFEKVGALKGKRWYVDQEHKKTGLFKPKRFEFGDKKVFCANHYGEVVAYAIADNADIMSCPAELAHLSKYYSNIHKELNNGTPEEKDGCVIYRLLDGTSILEPGQSAIAFYEVHNKEDFKKLTAKDKKYNERYDNIELALAATEARTREYYSYDSEISKEYIEMKVDENKKHILEMIIFDCLYGNNDRHDENWSMEKKIDGTDISIYPLYDNERVLGLYENQNNIENALATNTVKEYSDTILFSRMKVPGETKVHSNYEDVLAYLVNNYQKETTELLKRILSRNTPEKIDSILEECDGLPDCYKKFASQMHMIRYNFARKLYVDKGTNNKSQMIIYTSYPHLRRYDQVTTDRLSEYPEL